MRTKPPHLRGDDDDIAKIASLEEVERLPRGHLVVETRRSQTLRCSNSSQSFLARHPFIPIEESISMISTEDDSMSAAENIPVSKETYNQILDLRAPGETLDETLARLVEKVKKQRLTDDIEEVMARDEFVELDLCHSA